MTPLNQIKAFLDWFTLRRIDKFDIHLRKPIGENQDYKNNKWIWITDHENVDREYIETKLIHWLRRENANGSDVFFRPTHNKEHCVVFLDDVATDKAKKVMGKYSACAIETHKGNTQIWLGVDRPLNVEERKKAQQILMNLGFTDPGSVAGQHLGRMVGLRSQKRNCWVNLVGASNICSWCPDLSEAPNPKTVRVNLGATSAGGVDNSPSGREFGWVLGMLRAGMKEDMVAQKLLAAAANRGKTSPDKYVERTVKRAIAIIGGGT